uniref:EOG090X0BEK n=1 Tax=Daphnia lumholtzi TaxID=42856 RepID=A0A4Y7MB98_9CRUS|nr:EOG090X0BEK [Daphnia lumholtzi]
MAIVVSYGLCSAFGVFYGPVHSILPFLLLGIGIDDMFVIVQCWTNLTKEEMKRSLPVRIGITMKHAGVSITITSVTDFAAFAVGATTVLPSLRSFCIYSAVGILATYIFQASFFVAWLTLDQRRIESHRDGMIPCFIYRNWKPSSLSRIEPLQLFFSRVLAKYLFKWPTKVFILVLTAFLLGINTWGSVLMRQEFNPLWFIPTSTYLSQYFSVLESHYPDNGQMASIYIQTTNLSRNLNRLDALIDTVRNETKIVSQVDDWFGGFKEFTAKRHAVDWTNQNMTDLQFSTYLKNYLFTQKGAKFRRNFKFQDPLQCRSAITPPISVIMEELYRNLAIAMVCVFITTFILIANFSQQVRGMATLKMISIRLKSVKNIQKITQSMKMVSAAKYTKAERELKLARPYGIGSQEFYKKAEVKDEEGEKGQLIIAVSSDRGLCGAVHSSIGRIVKTDIAANPNTKVVIVGDKVRNILQRLYAKNIAMVVTEVGRKPAVFGDAALIAQSIINSGIEFSKGKILFNAFRTVVSFRTTEMPLYSQNAVANASKLPIYDSLDSDVIQSYTEFSLASLLFYSMKENATSEQSSRMTAMDNASKNAGEMIDKLTMTFNRTRQAVITRELIEIISGAAALETKN